MTTVHLDASDAAELTEMRTFIGDWLHHDRVQLEELLLNFVGDGSYDLDTLHADLARFCFLLGDDGARLFGTGRP
jgi:hypothetical protein